MSMCSSCFFLFPVPTFGVRNRKVFDCPRTSFVSGSRALAYFADKKNEDHDEEDCLKFKFSVIVLKSHVCRASSVGFQLKA